MKYPFLGFSIFFIFCLTYQNSPVAVQIRGPTREQDFVITMPLKDKKRLDSLFRHLCLVELWGHTLMRSKPVTFTGYKKPSFSARSLTHFIFFLKDLRRSWRWKTWLKYQTYFSDSPFQIFENADPACSSHIEMIIMDTEYFSQILKKYREDFQRVLGKKSIDPEALMKEAKQSSLLSEVLKNHDGLIGTVLGYGRENAWAFYDQSCGKDVDLVLAWEPELLDQMIVQLSKKDWTLTSWELSDLYYPCFMSKKNSEETIQLRQLYQKSREKFIRYYQGKDFVEATLSLLAGDSP